MEKITKVDIERIIYDVNIKIEIMILNKNRIIEIIKNEK